MYATRPLSSPYCFAAARLCRLFGKDDTTKFSIEWVPLIDANCKCYNFELEYYFVE